MKSSGKAAFCSSEGAKTKFPAVRLGLKHLMRGEKYKGSREQRKAQQC